MMITSLSPQFFITALSILLGMFYSWRLLTARGYHSHRVFDHLFGIALCTLLCAKWVVLFPFLSLSFSSLRELVWFWVPTYSVVGAVWGVVVGIILSSRHSRWSLFHLADDISPGVLLASLGICSAYLVAGSFRDTLPVEGSILLLLFLLLAQPLVRFPRMVRYAGFRATGAGVVIGGSYLLLNHFWPFLTDIERNLSGILVGVSVVGSLQAKRRSRSLEGEALQLRLLMQAPKRRLIMLQKLPGKYTEFSRTFIRRMQERLQSREKEIQQELELLKSEDPFAQKDRTADNAEMMAEADEQLGHEQVSTRMHFLDGYLKAVRRALNKISLGTYGVSEESGKPISLERLEANPVAIRTIEEEEAHEKSEVSELPPMERIN